MILGIGTDLVQISRIEEILKTFGSSFEDKVFTSHEQQKAATLPQNKKASFYAKRFAAKEAFSKALGSGIGISAFFKDIEVQNNEKGAPFLSIHGRAKETLQKKAMGKQIQTHISLSDEKSFASAFVVIEVL